MDENNQNNSNKETTLRVLFETSEGIVSGHEVVELKYDVPAGHIPKGIEMEREDFTYYFTVSQRSFNIALDDIKIILEACITNKEQRSAVLKLLSDKLYADDDRVRQLDRDIIARTREDANARDTLPTRAKVYIRSL